MPQILGFIIKKRISLATLCLTLALFLIPNFFLRIAISCILALLIVNSLNTVKKEYVFLSLFIFYCLAYIYSPYYSTFHALPGKILCFLLLYVFGVFWASKSAGTIKIDFKFSKKIPLIILGALLYLINFKALKADIPWRGDEDYHVNSVIILSYYINTIFKYTVDFLHKHVLITTLLFLTLVSIIGWPFKHIKSYAARRLKIIVLILSFCPILVIFFLGSKSLFDITVTELRYPLVQRWFSLIFTWSATYADIIFYRALPLLSTIFLSYFIFNRLSKKIKTWEALLFSLAFCTIPLVYFYTSLLYLEMPAVLLMTICLFDLRPLVCEKFPELLKRPSWYCLLLISFLKETVIIFLAIILVSRMVYQLKNRNTHSSKLKILFSEIKVCFLVLSPLFIYYFFREFFSSFRRYGMEFYHLASFRNYLIFSKALLLQLGILGITCIAGLVLLFKKDRLQFTVMIVLFLSTIYFFIADGMNIGLARWNIFLLPAVFFASFYFLTSIKTDYHIGMILALLCSNALLSPIPLDGIRLPNWPSPVIDTAEHVYPYDKSMEWLSKNNTKHLLLMGHYYEYYLYFYLHKHNFYPKTSELKFGSEKVDKNRELARLYYFFDRFDKVKSGKITDKSIEPLLTVDTILYHSVNNINLDKYMLYGNAFVIVKKISNSQNSLYIFKRTDHIEKSDAKF